MHRGFNTSNACACACACVRSNPIIQIEKRKLYVGKVFYCYFVRQWTVYLYVYMYYIFVCSLVYGFFLCSRERYMCYTPATGIRFLRFPFQTYHKTEIVLNTFLLKTFFDHQDLFFFIHTKKKFLFEIYHRFRIDINCLV